MTCSYRRKEGNLMKWNLMKRILVFLLNWMFVGFLISYHIIFYYTLLIYINDCVLKLKIGIEITKSVILL